ncbi:MAG TPA: peptidoglycan recognition protein, partial [Gaiellaceae bacterium]|nr:peptidoglycan recognition protein [Gaiellaceae bacterium]
MRYLRLALLLSLVSAPLLAPASARADDATIESRDVPLAGHRALAAAAAPPERFNLVGLHWRGTGSVQFRTRSFAGRWSGWQDAAPEAEDRPDVGTAERARMRRWRLGNPWWVGPSNRIEYRTRGVVTQLRAWFVWSPVASVPVRRLQRAASPPIVPRLAWKADETIRRGAPTYAPAVRYSVVHHTAGSNNYTAAQSAAIVKAIQVYHVKGNGWNDIGYNFLVDKYGQVFEGRYGGITRPVVGAHAEGFNTGSVGVAVLGEYSSLAITPKARDALARLLAWRLDLAHVDPLSTLSVPSGGNKRFPSGVPVFLRTVSGHRDTGFTDCPGA